MGPAVAVLLLGGAAAVAFAMVRKPVFKSETLILYRDSARPAADAGGGGEDGADRARKLKMRLKEMVLSRTRLEQIIKEANLYPSIVDDRGMIDAVDEMRKHIALRVQDGDTFGLSFEGEQPKRVQLVTAKLAEALIGEKSQVALEPPAAGAATPAAGAAAAAQAKELLDGEKRRVEAELKDKELALAQFVAKHPEFAGGRPVPVVRAPAPRPVNNPGKPDPALASLEHEAQRLQERLGTSARHASRDEAQADPALTAAKQEADGELKQAQKELTEKQAEFTDDHPDVRAAKARFKVALDKAKRVNDAYNLSLAAAKQKAVAKEEDEGYIDRGALENQLKRINDEIAEYKRRRANATEQQQRPTPVLASAVAADADWTRLSRDVADARERLGVLQEKELKAATVETAPAVAGAAQMTVIDPAFLPTHAAKPERTVIAAAGVAVALLLALALALFLAIVDDRLYDRVDVERLGLLPLLGVVPGPPKKVKRG